VTRTEGEDRIGVMRNEHFSNLLSEHNSIQRDIEHGRYNGFRNTFDEWERRKERAADAPQQESPEDEIEQRRRWL
jgi:hypothetical protein